MTVLSAPGTVGQSATYYPQGGMPMRTMTGTDKLFTGQQEEGGDLGLYNYGARFYSTKLGRFLSADPLVVKPGDPQMLDRYAYVRNNPLRYTDPTGLLTQDEWAALAEAGRQLAAEGVPESEWVSTLLARAGSPTPAPIPTPGAVSTPLPGQQYPPVPDECGNDILCWLKHTGGDIGGAVGDAAKGIAGAVASGYVDVGGTVCFPSPVGVGPCLSGGAQFGWEQGFHPYGGGGVGTPGGGLNMNYYPNQRITEGLSCGFQGGAPVWPAPGMFGIGPGGDVGYSGIWEKGSSFNKEGGFYLGMGPYIGTPGGSFTCIYVGNPFW